MDLLSIKFIFSKKVGALDDVLCGVLELELEEKIIRPSYVEYHFYYKKPDRLVLQSHNQRQEIDSLDIDLGYGVNYNPNRLLLLFKRWRTTKLVLLVLKI